MKRAADWCILRTSPGRTLELARSLAAAGLEIWTPKETQTRRRPRSTHTYEIEIPIAPTFVFACADHLADLLSIQSATINEHPRFSVFQHSHRIPLIAEREVEGMRAEEARLQADIDKRRAAADRVKRLGERRAKRRVIPTGDSVAIASGCFAGMTGVVEDGNRKEAFVNFGGNFVVKIETWRFAEDIVSTNPARKGNAAVAASELIGQT